MTHTRKKKWPGEGSSGFWDKDLSRSWIIRELFLYICSYVPSKMQIFCTNGVFLGFFYLCQFNKWSLCLKNWGILGSLSFVPCIKDASALIGQCTLHCFSLSPRKQTLSLFADGQPSQCFNCTHFLIQGTRNVLPFICQVNSGNT